MYNYLSATLQKAILLCSISTALLLLGIGHLFADGVGRGSVKDDVVPPISTDNLAQKWVGKHLVFLEILRAYDDQEYTDFHVIRPLGVERDRSIETGAGNPVYLQFAGKTVTITKAIACEKDPGSAFQEYSFFCTRPPAEQTLRLKLNMACYIILLLKTG